MRVGWKNFWTHIRAKRKKSFVCCFLLFRAVPAAYGSLQARGQIRAAATGLHRCSCWPTPQPQQHQTQATSATYTTAHGNAGSLTHWGRPGIEPTTSWLLWLLVRCISTTTVGTPHIFAYNEMVVTSISILCMYIFYCLGCQKLIGIGFIMGGTTSAPSGNHR